MEDFGYIKNEDRSSNLIRKIFLVSATLFSIGCFIYITISAYYFVYQDSAAIETIKSPEEPIKVSEEQKENDSDASMQINHAIYEDIFGNKKESLKTPKVRANEEAPLPPQLSSHLQQQKFAEEKIIVSKNTVAKSEDLAIVENKASVSPTNKNAQKIIVYSEKDKAKTETNTPSKQQPANKDLLTKKEGDVLEYESKTEDKPIKDKKVESKKRSVRVQIAAMTSKKAAQDSWNKLNKTYPSLFSGKKPTIEEVNLGKKGIFYRLQAGNFFNQVDAEEFCKQYVIKTHKTRADCIVVE